MQAKKILITGGAGFIGSHIADKLIEQGHFVRILDNLSPQVHPAQQIPEYLNQKAEFILGDIRNKEDVKKALSNVQIIIHLAAFTATGQSMYKQAECTDVNVNGTKNILDVIAENNYNIEKIIYASSRAVYGEGKYSCRHCGIIYPKKREEEQLSKQEWDIKCPYCNAMLAVLPTDEDTPLSPVSIYAETKRKIEKMICEFGKNNNIPFVIFRTFNAYGIRQAVENPYVGLLPIFALRIKSNKALFLYEDGQIIRDFVHVEDIADAFILGMTNDAANNQIFNLGSGQKMTLQELAKKIAKAFKSNADIRVIGKYRSGDPRHSYADISLIKNKIGFVPKMSFEKELKKFVEWIKTKDAVDNYDKAEQELKERGLFK